MNQSAKNRNPEKTISTREAAKILGISLRSAQLWVENGTLKAWKTAGGHRRIYQHSVEEQLAKRTQQNSHEPIEVKPPITILVVDDDPALLELYQTHISSWPFPTRLLTAKSGFDGLLMIGKYHPDVIISDLLMPNFDGFEMLNSINRFHSLDEIKVIVATHLSKAEIEQHGGLPDKYEMIQKPIPFEQLKSMVEQVRHA